MAGLASSRRVGFGHGVLHQLLGQVGILSAQQLTKGFPPLLRALGLALFLAVLALGFVLVLCRFLVQLRLFLTAKGSPLGGAVAVRRLRGSFRSPIILALRQPQLTVHDKLCGGFKVGVAVGDGLGVLRRELAQHPCGKVVVRVGLCTDADADAGEILPPSRAMMLFRPLCPPAEPEGRMRSLPGACVMSSHSTSTWSAGILKKPA